MLSYKITDPAEADIDQIFSYIAQDNLYHALHWLDKIDAAIDRLANFPFMGPLRSNLSLEPLRVWPIGRYLIIYRVSHCVEILRVVSAYRNLEDLFNP